MTTLGLTGKSLSTVNETYSEAKHQFSVRNRVVLMNARSLLISGGPLLSLLCSV